MTHVCLASGWPDAAPLRTVTAKAVTGQVFPLRFLTDRGLQFVESLGKELSKIEKLQTTAYHPETNGCIEHIHSILDGMLLKAKKDELDRVDQH